MPERLGKESTQLRSKALLLLGFGQAANTGTGASLYSPAFFHCGLFLGSAVFVWFALHNGLHGLKVV